MDICIHMNRRLLFAALLALFSLEIACNKSESPTSPTPADGPIFYTAIGASDGIGFGSSSPVCLSPTVPMEKATFRLFGGDCRRPAARLTIRT